MCLRQITLIGLIALFNTVVVAAEKIELASIAPTTSSIHQDIVDAKAKNPSAPARPNTSTNSNNNEAQDEMKNFHYLQGLVRS